MLEAHVNLMPYGRNVQGIGAASRIYFDKPPHALSLPEALSLVLIPRSPAHEPVAAEPAALRTARQRLLQRWQQTHRQKVHPQPDLDLPDAALPVHYRHASELPFLAPHFTTHLLAQVPPTARAAAVHTTLDVPLQRLLEGVLQSFVRERRGLGIHNAAALLVDHRDLAVRAMIGSADFHAGIAGQINGTLTRRAPGTMLDPFVHALTMDEGSIDHGSIDRGSIGPRSIDQGASKSPTALAIALSDDRVTMAQIATLYAMLANHGELAPLRYRADAAPQPRVRVLSAAASSMTLDTLAATARPPGLARPADGLRVAWKTGTSHGFRDAWAAGVLGPYVLVVWIGNVEGSGHPAFDGNHAAVPLFFQMLDALAGGDPRLLEPAQAAPINFLDLVQTPRLVPRFTDRPDQVGY